MTVNNLRPGDVIRVIPNQYQVVKIDPFARTLVVRDLLGHEHVVAGEYIEDCWEKVDFA